MTFPDRLRLPMRFDAARLRQDLGRLQGAAWIDHFVTQNYTGEWSVVPLRGPAGAAHPVMMIYSDPTARLFEDTPFLDEAPYMREVLAAFHCPMLSARLMRLTSGSLIKTHQDLDLDADGGVVRVHLPIVTHPDVDFRLNGRAVTMAAGSAWYLRLSDPHSVANRSPLDRVHLVMDMEVNAWLRAVLQEAAEGHAQPQRRQRVGDDREAAGL